MPRTLTTDPSSLSSQAILSTPSSLSSPSTSPSSSSFSSSSSSMPSPSLSHPPGHRLLLGIVHPPGALFSFGVLFMINLLNMIDRYIPSAVKTQIQDSYSLNYAESSLPLTIFIIVYMTSCPIFGYLADRGWSRRGLICAGVISWSALTAATAIAPNYAVYVLIRGSIGIGEASYATIAPAILSDWYDPKDRSKVLGLFYVGTPVGAALGYALGGLMGQTLGWRLAFAVIGLPGIVIGLLILRTQDPVRGATDAKGREEEAISEALLYQGETQWQAFKLLMTNPVYIITVIGQVAVVWGVGGLADWIPTYLQQMYNQSESVAGLGTGAATVIGGVGGCLLGSWLGEKGIGEVKNPYLLIPALGSIGAAFCALIVIAFTPPVWLVYSLLIMAQILLWWYLGPINALTANCVHSRHRTRAFAFSTFAQHALGDASSPSIIGAIADATDLSWAVLTIPIAWLVAAFTWVVGSRVLDEEVRGKEGLLRAEIPHEEWEEEGGRLGGKEIGGRIGDGSAMISEVEREEEALETVREAIQSDGYTSSAY